jgi:hypothetical protein
MELHLHTQKPNAEHQAGNWLTPKIFCFVTGNQTTKLL